MKQTSSVWIITISLCLMLASCTQHRIRDTDTTRHYVPSGTGGGEGVQFEGAIWTNARKEKKSDQAALYPDGKSAE
ncbi:MAG: hypothetical protein AAF571_04970 [Verrucomicrobiota bacterium]